MSERHCSNLQGCVHETVATTYGVSRDSILNELRFFHVTDGLPPDIMHDIFEGVEVVDLKCMLSVLIQELKLFSLSTLNSRIKCFPYGYPNPKSKPLPFPMHLLSTSPNDALKQSCKGLKLGFFLKT